MRMTAYLRRQTAWFVLCAVTVAAVAPTFSHWVASLAGQTMWVEICGVSGIEHVALDTGSAPAPQDDHGGTSHCPFCRLQKHLPVLPPADVALIVLAAVRSDAPPALDVRPLPSKPLWTPALSRAPPSFS